MKTNIGARLIGDQIEIVTERLKQFKTITRLEGGGVSSFVTMVLALASNAGEKLKPTEQANASVVIPTGYSLMEAKEGRPPVLRLHFGNVPVSFAVLDPKTLGEALIAAAAKDAEEKQG
ncbi:hypothetical protein HDIA_3492 [Hartmannibacter diazotrophicus]|uniref:Uncharacterized protein n=1 Tax=Hartmannibacter diazotrophicus TaxID=1482074 RepID=A0A2C9D9X9_9HYPH|nr:hypothetical protein [Hartmannibacter diazotrophicus]SON57033.1 hypothetical protein HDIA_3492 [Hartmannibacter diazotrophicus]